MPMMKMTYLAAALHCRACVWAWREERERPQGSECHVHGTYHRGEERCKVPPGAAYSPRGGSFVCQAKPSQGTYRHVQAPNAARLHVGPRGRGVCECDPTCRLTRTDARPDMMISTQPR